MPMYRSIACGNCGEPEEKFGPPYDVIGVPYFVCRKCNQMNSQPRLINEWDLKWDSERKKYYVYLVPVSMLFGTSLGIVIVNILKTWLTNQLMGMVLGWVIGISIGFVYLHH